MTHPAIRVDGRGSPSRLVTTSKSERTTPFLGVHHQKKYHIVIQQTSQAQAQLRADSIKTLITCWEHNGAKLNNQRNCHYQTFQYLPAEFLNFCVIEISVSRDTPLFLVYLYRQEHQGWRCRRKASGAAAVEWNRARKINFDSLDHARCGWHGSWVGNNHRCTSVRDTGQKAENTQRKARVEAEAPRCFSLPLMMPSYRKSAQSTGWDSVQTWDMEYGYNPF